MKVTFLGTGTSMGVPVAGGFGSENQSADPRDQRYRCSVWVRTEEMSLVIDTGPEFRLQTLRAGIKHIDAFLFTHEHTDHIGGLDDIRAYNYAQNQAIPAYTNARTRDVIMQRFSYMFPPDKTPGSVDLDFRILKQPEKVGDIRITPLPVFHGEMEIIGFRLNDFSYITDVSAIPEATAEKIMGSKVVVMSGLRWSPPHPTHFTIPEAIEAAEKLNVEKAYLIHMSPYVVHEEISRKLPGNVRLAYDQLQIEL
ncbi:MBL fold metallo-hydrolase [Balneolales bacterium ANBcel1]|nr:MBL fold metallo-hydrolase [Balneolales bacterium ANBcel1]